MFDKNNNIKIEVAGTQSTNLNNREIEESRCFISKVKGLFCGANADSGKGCGKTVNDLKTIWEADLIKQKKKPCKCEFVHIPTSTNQRQPNKCPECKGVIRIQPFLFVNEKQGNGLHRYIDEVFEYCGNVCFYCKSCNMIYDRKHGDIKPGEKATYQARKSHEVRPKFVNTLEDYLAPNMHICFKDCINRWSGMEMFKCSQETLENAFWQFYDVKFSLIDALEYGINCEYRKCDGNHIILKGHPPIVKKRDIDAFKEESRD